MLRSGRLSGLILTPLVAAALVVAGCGGGGGTDRTSGLSPQQILVQSRQAAAKVTSYHLDLDADASVRAQGLQGVAGTLLKGPLKLTGSGSVKVPTAATLDLTLDLGLLKVQGTVTKVGTNVYISLPILNREGRLDLPPATAARLTPDTLRTAILGWIRAPREVGREKVDGVDTVHLRGALDTRRASADLVAAARSLGLARSGAVTPAQLRAAQRQARAALKGGIVDIWIGTEDLQPRREAAAVKLKGRIDLVPQVRSGSLSFRLDFSKLDEPVDITAPANARTLRLQDLLRVPGLG
jgi:hypothetical protein